MISLQKWASMPFPVSYMPLPYGCVELLVSCTSSDFQNSLKRFGLFAWNSIWQARCLPSSNFSSFYFSFSNLKIKVVPSIYVSFSFTWFWYHHNFFSSAKASWSTILTHLRSQILVTNIHLYSPTWYLHSTYLCYIIKVTSRRNDTFTWCFPLTHVLVFFLNVKSYVFYKGHTGFSHRLSSYRSKKMSYLTGSRMYHAM